MGLMQGKVVGDCIYIMDSFALPVQGTETRVNAANEANEYMVEYIQGSEKVRTLLNIARQTFCSCSVFIGPEARERDWLVSLPSGIRMLAIRNRRQYADEQPEVPRSFRCSRRAHPYKR